MTHVVLLGAGFSRNWGGWLATEAFEYLLGCKEISADPELCRLLWKHQESGGFEDALDEIQTSYLRDPTNTHTQLVAFQAAVIRMFNDMNHAFLSMTDWEFCRQDQSKWVQKFLTRFDAVFSLNQDLLLERHYCNGNVTLVGARKWLAASMPGMQRTPFQEPLYSDCWARATWTPKAQPEFRQDNQCQPIFKDHRGNEWVKVEAF